MRRLHFRVRTLLILLLVALPPLVAFGAFALVTTSQSRLADSRASTDAALSRASELLARAVEDAGRAVQQVAADPELAAAAAAGDAEAAAARYAALAGGLPGWHARVTGRGAPIELAAADPTETGDRLDASIGGESVGSVVDRGRLLLAAGAPLNRLVEGADGLRLLVWRDATHDVLEAMRIAAGGTVAVEGGDGFAVAGPDAARLVALLGAAGTGTGAAAPARAEAVSHAARPVTLAGGASGRIAVLPEPRDVGFAAIGLAPALSVAGSLAVLWAVLLAVAFARSIGGELRRLAEAAEKVREGVFEPIAPVANDELGRLAAVHSRLAASLEERNRQIAELAVQITSLPVGDDPRSVVRAVPAAAARVTREESWRAVILDASAPDLIPPGRYGESDGAEPPPGPDAWERQAWRALVGVDGVDDDARVDHDPGARSRLIETPEGEFVVVLMAADERLEGILAAPWAGRRPPSAAEHHLFSLLGRHAGTAIEHAMLYATLRRQAGELERLASVQADFLRGVSHDLQTPLTSIAALSSELSARGDLEPQASADLRAIQEQAERLRRMVAQLLVVSRLDAGTVEPRQEVLRAEPIVRRTWSALRPIGRSLRLRTSDDHLVIADPDRLEQVLWALLDNAVKYSPPGSPVHVELGCRTRRVAEQDLQGDATESELVAEIAVTDHGMGMDAETQRRAFEQFYRSAEARSRVPDGSGIGLYAARGLVVAMGGTLTLESRAGSGTTLRIRLPAERVDRVVEPVDEATESTPQTAPEVAPGAVLVAPPARQAGDRASERS